MSENNPSPIEEESSAPIEEEIANALRTVYDPEIPVNIFDLGLIYSADRNDNGRIHVQMTLTSPNCPEAAQLPINVESAVLTVPGVSDVHVELVWEPQWTPEKMTEAANLQLNMM